MTLTFEFEDGTHKFSCPVQCQRCEERNANGRRCKNTVCIGVPYCWLHLQNKHHLKIKDSTIPGAGKGVFAWDPKKPAGAYVFPHGKDVIKYGGEPITNAEKNRRYRDKTGPYAIGNYINTKFEDAACKRGVGAMFNHKRGGRADLKIKDGVFKVTARQAIKNKEEIFVNYGNRYLMNDGGVYSTKRKTTYHRRNRRN